MGKINSKQKGKTGELELSKILREYGFDNSRRSVQYCGKAEEGQADIVGLPFLHIECKRVEKLNIDNAMAQAINDKNEGEIAVVVHRKNRQQWKVTLQLEDFIEIYKVYLESKK